jgi:hypothetical protein
MKVIKCKEILISLCFLLLSSHPKSNSERIETAFNFIKNDISHESGKDTKLIVSKELIPFNLITISEDVIRKRYIKNYTIFRELTELERRIEKSVNDSLVNLENNLNEIYKANLRLSLKKKYTRKKSPNYIVFVSIVVNDLLYAEVLEYNNTTSREFAAYGTAITYLFRFDPKGKIIDVYKGSISLN